MPERDYQRVKEGSPEAGRTAFAPSGLLLKSLIFWVRMKMLNSYNVLGIAPDATPAQVRLAYIGLMKRCHPDAPGSDQASEELARDVNRAFWILRDPERRAAHDRMLLGRSDNKPPVRRPPIVPAPPSPLSELRPRGGRRAGRGLGLGIAAAALMSLGAFAYAQPQRLESLFREPALAREAPAPEARAWREASDADAPPVESWQVHGAVGDLRQMVREGGVGAAAAYSRRCFGELAAQPNYVLLDHCIAFDTAAALVERAPSQRRRAAIDPYFEPPIRERRQREAVQRVIRDAQAAEARRRELEQETISALATDEWIAE